MQNVKILAFLLLFLSAASNINGLCLEPHRIYVGPEFYHAKRTKKGGSEQSGWLYGGRGLYERRCQGGMYWAINGYYSCGELSGDTASGKTLKSDIREREIEGRIGWTIFLESCKLAIIPYGAYGYSDSENDFKKPSPLIYKTLNHFNYGAWGIQASFTSYCSLEFGVDVEVKYMTEGKSKVTNDPDFDDFTLVMNNETQYEVDLPIRYTTCWKNRRFSGIIAPFYRHRHYGGMMNWPFDFVDTKFQIWGIKFLFNITI